MMIFLNVTPTDIITVEPIPKSLRIMHSICALTIAASGVVGNTYTIIRMSKKHLYQQKFNLYLVNLAVNNFISCILLLPIIGINSFFEGWIYGPVFCDMFAFLLYTVLCAEANALILLTLNRFFRVSHPLTYPKIYDRWVINAIIIALGWCVYAFVLLLPVLEVWGEIGFDNDKNYCTILRKDKYLTFLAGINLGFCAPVVFLSYASIFITFKKSKQKVANVKQRTQSDSSEEPSNSGGLSQKEIRLLRTILLIMACFVLTYMPFLIANIVDPTMVLMGRWAHTTCIYLSWLHVSINPFIYTYSNAR